MYLDENVRGKEGADTMNDDNGGKRRGRRKKIRVNPWLVLLNVVVAAAGVVLIGAGVWIAQNHTVSCIHFLQGFCVGAGLFMVVVAAAGLVGSFRRIPWLLYINFGVLLAILVAVLATTAFVLAVTSHGIKAYVSESQRDAASRWLLDQVNGRIERCTQGGDICRLVAYYGNSYYRPSLSSLQVACCQPPAECNNLNMTSVTALVDDCDAWRQLGPQGFCSDCRSCRAAVAEKVRRVWHEVAIVKVIILIVLIPTYFFTFFSFKRQEEEARDDSDNRCCLECLCCCYSCL
ncbi:hypothetical protein KP509_38G015600 [Ceratopteris richardii]|uniref:Uncharacterized protein n=1 Tax=Ceratopteris richardii TaxID=49495 RepID=A0A8T2Q2N7_CERRI|nr:hypothetical protein KP509_38G015600 [Ceratopteris richardii]